MVYSFRNLFSLFACISAQILLPAVSQPLSRLNRTDQITCSNNVTYMKFLDGNSIQILEGQNVSPSRPVSPTLLVTETQANRTVQIIANTLYVYENATPKYCFTNNEPISRAAVSNDNALVAVSSKNIIDISQSPEQTIPDIKITKSWYARCTQLFSTYKWRIANTVAHIAAGACLYACYNKYKNENWNPLNLFWRKNDV